MAIVTYLTQATYSRMNDLASIKQMQNLNSALNTLVSDWLDEGFDEEDVENFIRIKISETISTYKSPGNARV